MFDLEKAIAEWRRQMLAAGIKSPALLDELESHLREETGMGVKAGLTGQNAFEAAVQKIGGPNMIKNEFKKIGGASNVLEWLMIAICAAFVALIIFLGGATVVMCFTKTGDRVMAAASMVSSVLVALGWKRAIPFLPVVQNTWKRVATGLGCIVFGFVAAAFFCNVILPYFETGEDHSIPAIGFWAVFIIAVFACLGMGLSFSEKEREKLGMGRS